MVCVCVQYSGGMMFFVYSFHFCSQYVRRGGGVCIFPHAPSSYMYIHEKQTKNSIGIHTQQYHTHTHPTISHTHTHTHNPTPTHTLPKPTQAPDELRAELIYTAAACGLATQQELQQEATWNKLWKAVCKVWSSKWNDRAWLSRQANGIADEDLVMSCLIQQVCLCVCVWVCGCV